MSGKAIPTIGHSQSSSLASIAAWRLGVAQNPATRCSSRISDDWESRCAFPWITGHSEACPATGLQQRLSGVARAMGPA